MFVLHFLQQAVQESAAGGYLGVGCVGPEAFLKERPDDGEELLPPRLEVHWVDAGYELACRRQRVRIRCTVRIPGQRGKSLDNGINGKRFRPEPPWAFVETSIFQGYEIV